MKQHRREELRWSPHVPDLVSDPRHREPKPLTPEQRTASREPKPVTPEQRTAKLEGVLRWFAIMLDLFPLGEPLPEHVRLQFELRLSVAKELLPDDFPEAMLPTPPDPPRKKPGRPAKTKNKKLPHAHTLMLPNYAKKEVR